MLSTMPIRRLELYKQEGYTEVLDADSLHGFNYDRHSMTPPQLIMDRLRERIADGWVLNSIENMLKAGVMEDGILHLSSKTIRQPKALRKEVSYPLFLPTLSVTSLTSP